MKPFAGVCLVILFFSSCVKSTIEKQKSPPNQIVEKISVDPLFTDYIPDLVFLLEK